MLVGGLVTDRAAVGQSYSVAAVLEIDQPLDLNGSGAVVGRSLDSQEFLYWDGDLGLQTIAPSDGYQIMGLNDAGQVIGGAARTHTFTETICSIPDIGYQCEPQTTNSTVYEGFVWEPGMPTPPAGQWTDREPGRFFDVNIDPLGTAREDVNRLLVGEYSYELVQSGFETQLRTTVTTKLSDGTLVVAPYELENPNDAAFDYIKGYNGEYILWTVAGNTVLAPVSGEIAYDVAGDVASAYPGLHPANVHVDTLTPDNRVTGSFQDPNNLPATVRFVWDTSRSVEELTGASGVVAFNGLGWGPQGPTSPLYYNGSELRDVNDEMSSADSGWAIEGIIDINDRRQFLARGRLNGGDLQTVLLDLAAFRWIDPAGGVFADSGNWDQNASPDGASHTAVFDLSDTYAVDLDAPAQTGTTRISRGDMTMNLNSNTLTIADKLVVGDTAGQDATLRIPEIDGLIAGDIVVGEVDRANGLLVLGPDAAAASAISGAASEQSAEGQAEPPLVAEKVTVKPGSQFKIGGGLMRITEVVTDPYEVVPTVPEPIPVPLLVKGTSFTSEPNLLAEKIVITSNGDQAGVLTGVASGAVIGPKAKVAAGSVLVAGNHRRD